MDRLAPHKTFLMTCLRKKPFSGTITTENLLFPQMIQRKWLGGVRWCGTANLVQWLA
jgi:hypothetical protein